MINIEKLYETVQQQAEALSSGKPFDVHYFTIRRTSKLSDQDPE